MRWIARQGSSPPTAGAPTVRGEESAGGWALIGSGWEMTATSVCANQLQTNPTSIAVITPQTNDNEVLAVRR